MSTETLTITASIPCGTFLICWVVGHHYKNEALKTPEQKQIEARSALFTSAAWLTGILCIAALSVVANFPDFLVLGVFIVGIFSALTLSVKIMRKINERSRTRSYSAEHACHGLCSEQNTPLQAL